MGENDIEMLRGGNNGKNARRQRSAVGSQTSVVGVGNPWIEQVPQIKCALRAPARIRVVCGLFALAKNP
jgi:hypothetical protein